MEHLNGETLARLVDDTPTPTEREHLEACATCAAEVQAYRDQTEALGALPELLPPRGDWRDLEARMRSEGLIRDHSLMERLGRTRTPGWMKTAAAVVLFLGGTGAGLALATHGPGAAARGADTSARFASREGSSELAGAAERVREAEARYVDALISYRQLLDGPDATSTSEDPSSRFAALEYLVRAGQAAVRQAPADPFLNGLLASTLAERDATLRTISTRKDAWF